MNDLTRHELDAKLEAMEARMDSRVASIEGKIDSFLSVQAVRDKASDTRFQRIEEDMRDLRSDFKSSRNLVVATVISSALVILFGVAGVVMTLTSNMLSAFQAGLNAPQAPHSSPSSGAPPPLGLSPIPVTPSPEPSKPIE